MLTSMQPPPHFESQRAGPARSRHPSMRHISCIESARSACALTRFLLASSCGFPCADTVAGRHFQCTVVGFSASSVEEMGLTANPEGAAGGGMSGGGWRGAPLPPRWALPGPVITGPVVFKSVSGEEVDFVSLGGAATQNV